MAVPSGGKEPENVLKDLLSVQTEVSRGIGMIYNTGRGNDFRGLCWWEGRYLAYLHQVTERLLDAEEQKLRLLKAEIEIARHTGGANASRVSNVTVLRKLNAPYHIEQGARNAGEHFDVSW